MWGKPHNPVCVHEHSVCVYVIILYMTASKGPTTLLCLCEHSTPNCMWQNFHYLLHVYVNITQINVRKTMYVWIWESCMCAHILYVTVPCSIYTHLYIQFSPASKQLSQKLTWNEAPKSQETSIWLGTKMLMHLYRMFIYIDNEHTFKLCTLFHLLI